MSKVEYEEFYGIWKDGQNTNEFPMCPKCGEPTYSHDECPFCGEKLEYEDKIKKYCAEKIEDEEMERFSDFITQQVNGIYCYVAKQEDTAMRKAAAEYAKKNNLDLRELDADVVDEIIDLGIHEYLIRHNGKLKE